LPYCVSIVLLALSILTHISHDIFFSELISEILFPLKFCLSGNLVVACLVFGSL
jgi:hypothetical protein